MNTIPLRKGSHTLIDLINRDNGTNYKYGKLMLGDPIPLTGKSRNTGLRIWEKSTSSEQSGTTVYYNRLDIEKVFKMMWGNDKPLQLDVTGYSRLSEMVDVLNKEYSFDFILGDLVDMEFDSTVPYAEAVLHISPKSHLYTGTIAVQLYSVDFSTIRITSDGRIRMVDNDVRYIN
jgi:hypothetical protein